MGDRRRSDGGDRRRSDGGDRGRDRGRSSRGRDPELSLVTRLKNSAKPITEYRDGKYQVPPTRLYLHWQLRGIQGSREVREEKLRKSTTMYIGNLSFYTTEEQVPPTLPNQAEGVIKLAERKQWRDRMRWCSASSSSVQRVASSRS